MKIIVFILIILFFIITKFITFDKSENVALVNVGDFSGSLGIKFTIDGNSVFHESEKYRIVIGVVPKVGYDALLRTYEKTLVSRNYKINDILDICKSIHIIKDLDGKNLDKSVNYFYKKGNSYIHCSFTFIGEPDANELLFEQIIPTFEVREDADGYSI